MEQPVIFFDGVCNLCNGFVQFVIKHDPKGKFKFASLQSKYAQERLVGTSINQQDMNTVVLIYKDNIYTKSTAALKIAKLLKSIWSILYIFIILPKFIRDFLYDLVAKNRYKWFGEKDSCMMPSPELKSRFLE